MEGGTCVEARVDPLDDLVGWRPEKFRELEGVVVEDSEPDEGWSSAVVEFVTPEG